MDEEILKNEENTQTEQAPLYTPRPKWQVIGAWIALGVFVAFLLMYYTNLFRGGA